MTMHLERGLTTLNTRKRKTKKKDTKSDIQRWKNELRDYNKKMRQCHAHNMQMTWDEYVDYVKGRYKPKNPPTAIKEPWHYSGPSVRQTEHVPSLNSKDSFTTATKRKPMEYTGERRLLGIATMHKSNLVPVFSDEDAKELAKMRR